MKSREKIKMRKSKAGECDICEATSDKCLDLYDLALGKDIFTLCDECVEKVFVKTLKATVQTNKRLKSQHDLQIINKRARNRYINEGISGRNPSEVYAESGGKE